MKIILAVDVETTGLDPKYNEITQFAGILLRPNGEEIARYDTYVMPKHPNRALSFRDDGKVFNCLQYAGITLEQLQCNGKSAEEFCSNLVEWLQGEIDFETMRWTDIIVMGQNPQFDKGFLLETFQSVNGLETTWPFDYHLLSTDSMYYEWYYQKYGKAPWSITSPTLHGLNVLRMVLPKIW
jgi:DNA polymerase III epsilon subunit-like protein